MDARDLQQLEAPGPTPPTRQCAHTNGRTRCDLPHGHACAHFMVTEQAKPPTLDARVSALEAVVQAVVTACDTQGRSLADWQQTVRERFEMLERGHGGASVDACRHCPYKAETRDLRAEVERLAAEHEKDVATMDSMATDAAAFQAKTDELAKQLTEERDQARADAQNLLNVVDGLRAQVMGMEAERDAARWRLERARMAASPGHCLTCSAFKPDAPNRPEGTCSKRNRGVVVEDAKCPLWEAKRAEASHG